jgi:hypothetical protein
VLFTTQIHKRNPQLGEFAGCANAFGFAHIDQIVLILVLRARCDRLGRLVT